MEIRSRIGSKKIPVEIIFARFKNVNIFKRLLPKSCRFKILTQKKFCFKLSGMPEIFLDVEKIFDNEKIIYSSFESKFDFTLEATFTETSKNQTDLQLIFKGTFNSVMIMMIKNPIKNFFDEIISNFENL